MTNYERVTNVQQLRSGRDTEGGRMSRTEIEYAFDCQISETAWAQMSDEQRRRLRYDLGKRWAEEIWSKLPDEAWLKMLCGEHGDVKRAD